ncbi:hypothetical protein DMB95_07020 [Campylobacter sp. MIT 12-8780]|uniref:hypothetical protein n=1 Tax=unclassified Campylobacter TaxID=2593542 RepID=UPI00115C5C52|nr:MULTISPECIES: hypothetical protein [unclassified Campylobacter]NDJ27715.1 hypothetical protein [Campylobacter sp. MIT 19-121]TQR40877.1 hypothetical protein DMB95_07020 [Campylobacter sp. MIT 12-8780]
MNSFVSLLEFINTINNEYQFLFIILGIFILATTMFLVSTGNINISAAFFAIPLTFLLTKYGLFVVIFLVLVAVISHLFIETQTCVKKKYEVKIYKAMLIKLKESYEEEKQKLIWNEKIKEYKSLLISLKAEYRYAIEELGLNQRLKHRFAYVENKINSSLVS